MSELPSLEQCIPSLCEGMSWALPITSMSRAGKWPHMNPVIFGNSRAGAWSGSQSWNPLTWFFLCQLPLLSFPSAGRDRWQAERGFITLDSPRLSCKGLPQHLSIQNTNSHSSIILPSSFPTCIQANLTPGEICFQGVSVRCSTTSLLGCSSGAGLGAERWT